MACCVYVSVLLVLGFVVGSYSVLDLGGEWVLNEANLRFMNLKAKVPGGIYSDLMDNRVIGDVFYGFNDTATRWVAKSNWTYQRSFIADTDLLNQTNIKLVFEGLDTFATILLNGVEIGTSKNMFVRYIFNAKPFLKSGNNSIEVRFYSPITIANDLATKQNYTIPPNCPPEAYRGECHANQIRKMQASFSWDWGPALPSMGIWKRVYLEGYHSSVIRYVIFRAAEAPDDAWLITITTYLDSGVFTGKILHKLETDVGAIDEIVPVNASGDAKIVFNFTIPRLIVRRWWPNGYGSQKLYNLVTEYHDGTGSAPSSKMMQIAFRTIELVQEPIGNGLSFYFKINNVPIFAKGSNEIPLDILPEKGQSPALIKRVLQTARDSNMNMLRVWGGGVYESDLFYSLADQYGILIWQDFMFACAMYPANAEFLSNVREEVQHQVKRLSSHPCIALWAGNNENEVALAQNWYSTSDKLTRYKNDYVKLYIKTIKSEFEQITDAIYITSSPSNGVQSDKSGYLSKDPQNDLFGDVHFYNYFANSLESSTYPIPRFASEFGYQSLPDVQSWLTATSNCSFLDLTGAFMSHRQHHPLGLIQNTLLINYQLKVPDSPETYIYYSQILQAMSIKFEVEHYRSFMGRLDGQGHGNTMGALYWQLNDVWVAPTWSGMDYTGKWKMLQYYAKDFFAATIVTAFLNVQRQLQIFVVSEVPSLFDSPLDVSLAVDVFKWDSFNAVNTSQFNLKLHFGKSLQVATISADSYLQKLGACGPLAKAKNNCFFYLTLHVGSVVMAPPNLVLVAPLKNSNLVQANIAIISIVEIGANRFELTIFSDGIALFVWLDSHGVGGRFSENGFGMVTPTRTVEFAGDAAVSKEELKHVLTVTHLKQNNE